jgi:hypothetical protein
MDQNNPTTPPAADVPQIDVAAITQTATQAAVEAATKAVQSRIEELSKDQKILADTIAASNPGLSAEQIAELATKAVNDTLAGREQKEATAAARRATIEKLVAEKLGGNANLAAFIQGDDAAALTASADALAEQLRTIRPDFGGATKAGGTPPAAGNDRSFRGLLR